MPDSARHVEPRSGDLLRPGMRVLADWLDAAGVQRSGNLDIDGVRPDGLTLRLSADDAGCVPPEPGAELALLVVRQPPEAYLAAVSVLAVRAGSPPLVDVTAPVRWERTTQRRTARVHIEVPVSVGDVGARVLDLGLGGCRLLWGDTLPPGNGMLVPFDLALPGIAGSVAVRGRIVWTELRDGRLPLAGVQFVELGPSERDALQTFVFRCQQALLRSGLLLLPRR